MNFAELRVNINENYKDCDERLEKAYLNEFSNNYSSSKLDKIWDCIQENHIFAKAPELGNIFKYMALVGIPRTKDNGIYYNRCTELKDTGDKDYDGDIIYRECGTKYSLNSKFCPVCNHTTSIEKPVMNSKEVTKCNVFPGDLRILNEICATCKMYQKNSLVRGSKCTAWNSHDDFKKSGKRCDDCCCKKCCNDKPMNAHEHASIERLVKRVDKTTTNDHVKTEELTP